MHVLGDLVDLQDLSAIDLINAAGALASESQLIGRDLLNFLRASLSILGNHRNETLDRIVFDLWSRISLIKMLHLLNHLVSDLMIDLNDVRLLWKREDKGGA